MILAENNKGRFDYEVLKTWEAGIVLFGHEVKSVRAKQIKLRGSFVTITIDPKTTKPQVSLLNCHISKYTKAGPLPTYKPDRTRSLILHQKEISSIYGQIAQKGLTLIPLKVYTRGTKIKVEIALVKGKKKFDKKETIKKRDIDRDVRRQLKYK
ncbi:MAG: SsrA-binding protein SmpB [Patescibacteria group bacterium]|jgi:SsrA-binding protein